VSRLTGERGSKIRGLVRWEERVIRTRVRYSIVIIRIRGRSPTLISRHKSFATWRDFDFLICDKTARSKERDNR
jgi:hypothetical protein